MKAVDEQSNPPMSVTTRVADDAPIRITTIDDGKANALSFSVLKELRVAVHAAATEHQVLVIGGRSGYFSAGFDLAVMRGEDGAARQALLTDGGDLFRDMVSAPIPIVAACTGHALAAGALLLLSADYRVGSTSPAKIGLNEVSIGMPLPPMAMALARHRIPSHRLTVATAFADVLTPEAAVEAGFLDALSTSPLDAAVEKARWMSSLSRKAFAVTKKRLRKSLLAEMGEA
jgi:enoyl-CoA hydratase